MLRHPSQGKAGTKREAMLAIFLSFRVAGAGAALIGAAEQQARFDLVLAQGRSAPPLVMR
jgi:hypothetical protein